MPMVRNNSNSFLASAPIKSLIWKFALPGIVSQLVNAVYNIVDQIFVGWGIGDLGIAAITVVFPLATITTALAVLFGSGAAAKFSLLMGEGQEDEARGTIGNGISLMLLSGIVLALAAMAFLEPVLRFFGATDLIMPYAQPYARIICIGIPFGIFSAGASNFIRADGSPNFSSAVLLSGALFNIILTLTTIKSVVIASGLRDPWWQSITTGAMLCFFILLQSIILASRGKGGIFAMILSWLKFGNRVGKG